MEKLRVNLKTTVANSAIKYEKRNGRDVIIVPSATLPDDIVMNRIKYPAAAIANGFSTLDRTPAPLGHPIANGEYISAFDPEAINQFWVGAWNENVRRVNGRVYLDKVIDVEVAERTARGKMLLDAIKEQKPISTSTGLMLELQPIQNNADYDYIVVNMVADHDAILLNEQPAASPEQGVGIFVNSKGDRVPVQNLELDDDAIEDIAESIAWQLEHEERQEQRKGLIAKIVELIRSALPTLQAELREATEGNALSVNHQEGDTMSDEKIKELETKLTDLQTNALTADKLTEALKPITDAVAALTANQKSAEESERNGLVEKVVKANLLEEADAKELTTNALRKLADKIPAAAPAHGVFGAMATNTSDDLSADLPE